MHGDIGEATSKKSQDIVGCDASPAYIDCSVSPEDLHVDHGESTELEAVFHVSEREVKSAKLAPVRRVDASRSRLQTKATLMASSNSR